MLRATLLAGVAVWTCAALPAHAAIRTAGNDVLVVSIDEDAPAVGLFTIRTGNAHPHPRFSVFYPLGTSYVTLRDDTAQEVWANAGETVNTAIEPYAARSMQRAPAAAAIEAIPGGFRTVYALPEWRVTQEVVVTGATLEDTRVRHTLVVQNTSAVTRRYGLRTLWDWEIADEPESLFRPRRPDGAYTTVFTGFAAPAFEAFELIDRAIGTTYGVYGTVGGGPLVPAPTRPDRLAYVQWLDFYEAPWDREVLGSDEDAATVHFWGHAAPLVLPPGGSTSFHQYVSAHPAAIGMRDIAPVEVPAVAPWALAGLAAALVGLARLARR